MALNVGDTLFNGHYRILRLLGRGGFGFVYLAEDTLLSEEVAIKELIPALVGDETMLKRFLAEAKATMRLTHERIVRTHNVFRERDNYYIVMEYMPGGSLEERLQAQGTLPMQDAVRIAAQVCEGLEYAHQRQVVHCDLKPANILFARDGSAKVGDFGIAHVSGEMLTRSWHTPAGFVAGTLPYMSPEQTEGVRDDPRLDLYALGAVLYRMVTGRTYLDFDTRETPRAQSDNVQQIYHQQPLAPSSHNSSLPAWLDTATLTALRKRPEERYSNADQMRLALLQVSVEQVAGAALLPRKPTSVRTQPTPSSVAASRHTASSARRQTLPTWLLVSVGGGTLLSVTLLILLVVMIGGSKLWPGGASTTTPSLVAAGTRIPGPSLGGTDVSRLVSPSIPTLTPTYTATPLSSPTATVSPAPTDTAKPTATIISTAVPVPSATAAVTPEAVQAQAPALKGTISLWHSWKTTEVPFLNQVVSAFQAEHPDVQLDILYVHIDDLPDKFINAVSAGGGPTILIGASDWGSRFYNSGLTVDISQKASAQFLGTINSAALDAARYKGALIGLPDQMKGVLIFRNLAIMPEAPTTWNDLVSRAQGVTRDEVVGAHLEYGFFFSIAHLHGMGGRLMDQDGNPAFNNAKGLEWINLLKSFKEVGPTEYYSDSDVDRFKAGKAGIIIDGSWNASSLAEAIGPGNLAIDPWPAYGDGHLSGYVQVENLYLNSNASAHEQELAWKFMEFFLSPEMQSLSAGVDHIPVTTSAQVSNRLMSQMMRAMARGTGFPALPELAAYWMPMDTALKSILNDGQDPVVALQQAHDSIVSGIAEIRQ